MTWLRSEDRLIDYGSRTAHNRLTKICDFTGHDLEERENSGKEKEAYLMPYRASDAVTSIGR